MTTTISNATLTVTVTEAVTLNGYDQGSSNTLTIPNVDEVVKRIVTISTTETGLLSFSAASTTAVATSTKTMFATSASQTRMTLTLQSFVSGVREVTSLRSR